MPNQTVTMTEQTDFATALRDYLTLLGVTKDELARRIHRSPAAMTNWTRPSASRIPALEDVIAMEDALGLKRGSLTRFLGHDLSENNGDGNGPDDGNGPGSWQYHYTQWTRLAPITDGERDILLGLMRQFIETHEEFARRRQGHSPTT